MNAASKVALVTGAGSGIGRGGGGARCCRRDTRLSLPAAVPMRWMKRWH